MHESHNHNMINDNNDLWLTIQTRKWNIQDKNKWTGEKKKYIWPYNLQKTRQFHKLHKDVSAIFGTYCLINVGGKQFQFQSVLQLLFYHYIIIYIYHFKISLKLPRSNCVFIICSIITSMIIYPLIKSATMMLRYWN